MKINRYNKLIAALVILIFNVCLLFSAPVFSAEYNGILHYAKAVDLTTPTTGIISNVSSVGKFFLKSQLLLAFDSSVKQSQISALNSKLVLQQKIYSEAKREYQRSKELYDGTMLSDHELKIAEIGELKEKSQLDNIKSQLVDSQWELKHYQLNAPFDGFMVASNVGVDQYINNRFKATPMLKFVAAQDIIFHIKLRNSQLSSQSKIMDLKLGDIVTIKTVLDNDRMQEYKASYLAFVEEENNKLFIFKLIIKESSYNKLSLLLDQSFIKLLIE